MTYCDICGGDILPGIRFYCANIRQFMGAPYDICDKCYIDIVNAKSEVSSSANPVADFDEDKNDES